MFELPEDTALRRQGGIGARQSFAYQIIHQRLCALCELLGRCGNRRAETRLVELLAALGDRRDERDSETAAPIAEEIRKAGGAIVLIRPQLRVRDNANGYEEETV